MCGLVLYRSETWILLQEDMNRLQAVEMLIWMRMMKVSWKERKTNEDILSMVQKEKSMVSSIRKKQKSWIDHILRGNSLMKNSLEGRMKGKKIASRLRWMLLDGMFDEDREWNYQNVKELSQD